MSRNSIILVATIVATFVTVSGGAIVARQAGQSHAMDYALGDVRAAAATASAPWLEASGVGACAADHAASASGVWPWQARATGKSIAVQCFEDFKRSIFHSLPPSDAAKLSPVLEQIQAALAST